VTPRVAENDTWRRSLELPWQSTAAIVGLAGGFPAARLVSHRADIATERKPLRAVFVELTQQLRTWNAVAKQLLDSLQRAINQAQTQRENGTLGQEPIALTEISTLNPGGGRTSPGSRPITEQELQRLEAGHALAERFAASIQLFTDPKALQH
jgi:hypothetical protein